MLKQSKSYPIYIQFVILSCFLFYSCQRKASWRPLFNGENLTNFQVLNGSAEYKIDNGCIVGVSHKNTPNTFLATKEIYTNFILEFEVWADPLLNSGVQIRSVIDPSVNDGSVYGHQIEIE